jgi:signal transduction histidine kinase
MTRKISIAGILFLAFVFSTSAKALEPLIPLKGEHVGVKISNIELINDAEGKYSINDIVSGKAGKFSPATKTNFGFGYPGVMWAKLLIDFSYIDETNLYLIQKYLHVKMYSTYQKNGNEFVVQNESGYVKLDARKYVFNEFIFDIHNTKAELHEIYLRIDPGSHALRLEFEVTDTKGLINRINETQFALGLFFGALLIMFFYNLFILFYLRKITYLYYAYYLASFIVVFWYLSGYVPIFIAGSKTIFGLFTVFGYTAVHGLLVFARLFLILKGRAAFICKIFEYATLGSMPLIFILPINPYLFLNILLMLSMLFLSIVSVMRIYEGYKPAVLYFIGWLAFAVTAIVYALRSLGYTELSFFTKYGLMMASVWEAVFFALALAYSFRLIEKESISNLEVMLEKKSELSKTVSNFEEFKMKLGQDVHDELGQRMVALKFGAAILEANPSADNAKAISREIINTVSKIQSEINNILEGLRPPILDSLGIRAAICALIDDIEAGRGAPHFDVQIPAFDESIVEPAQQIAIFRVAQEAITNALKHSKAAEIYVSLTVENACHITDSGNPCDIPNGVTRILITVKDNGAGFDSRSQSSGFGLSGMKKRVDDLYGCFRLDTKPGKGTTVLAAIPVKT